VSELGTITSRGENDASCVALFIKRIALRRHIFEAQPDELLGSRRASGKYSEEDFTEDEDEDPANNTEPSVDDVPKEPMQSQGKEQSDDRRRTEETKQPDCKQ
jgi:hypothetical protein